MEKIPTLEESYYDLKQEIEKIINSNCQDIPYEGTEVDKSTMTNEILSFLFENRVKFAKLHVEAALKTVSKKTTYGMLVVPLFNEDQREVILNSYPLENIK